MRGIDAMNVLQEQEWEYLSEVIRQMNSISEIDKMRLHFLKMIQNIVDYDFAEFSLGEVYDSTYLKLVDPVVVSNFSSSFEVEFMDQYESRYGDIDYVKWVFSSQESIVYKESDLIREDIRKKSPFYLEYLEPSGLVHVAGMSIIEDSVFAGAVTFYRKEEKEDFAARDLYILKALLPHLENRLKAMDHMDLYHHRDKKLLNEHHLTLREYEIIRFVCAGCSNLEISQRAGISIPTVKKHINNIFEKVGLKSRAQLITLFLGKTRH
jgi:DNA-binding CsgD family transcriptional regulator